MNFTGLVKLKAVCALEVPRKLANTGAAEAANRSRRFIESFPFLKWCLYRLCRKAAPVSGLGNDRLV